MPGIDLKENGFPIPVRLNAVVYMIDLLFIVTDNGGSYFRTIRGGAHQTVLQRVILPPRPKYIRLHTSLNLE
jgi:hypothetical protein